MICESKNTCEYITLSKVIKKYQDDFFNRQMHYKNHLAAFIDEKLLSLSEDDDSVRVISLNSNSFRNFKEFKNTMKLAVLEAKSRGFKVHIGKEALTSQYKKAYIFYVSVSGW